MVGEKLAANGNNIDGEEIRHCFFNFPQEIRDVIGEIVEDGVEDVYGSKDEDPLDYLVSGVVKLVWRVEDLPGELRKVLSLSG